MDLEEQEARAHGEQVTRCPDCHQLVADALLYGHQRRHDERQLSGPPDDGDPEGGLGSAVIPVAVH